MSASDGTTQRDQVSHPIGIYYFLWMQTHQASSGVQSKEIHLQRIASSAPQTKPSKPCKLTGFEDVLPKGTCLMSTHMYTNMCDFSFLRFFSSNLIEATCQSLLASKGWKDNAALEYSHIDFLSTVLWECCVFWGKSKSNKCVLAHVRELCPRQVEQRRQCTNCKLCVTKRRTIRIKFSIFPVCSSMRCWTLPCRIAAFGGS